MQPFWQKKKQCVLRLSGLVLLVLLFAGCGGSSAASSPSSSLENVQNPKNVQNPSSSLNVSKSANGSNQETSASDVGPQYLVKALNIDMQVKNTRNVANSIQTWITTTDPHATSSGTNYQQAGDNLYDISLTFSVQATIYPQIYQYLRDYTMHNGGRLAKFNESVQDVTNTYVDTQSRLKNLRVAQGRLQDLLSHAQTLDEILTIQQKLTDIEGQIESDEAQFNTLTSQVTFYTISISLEPIDVASPPSPQDNDWSISQIFHNAFTASLSFGEGIITLTIWLFAFSFYLIPLVVVVWLVRRWYQRSKQIAQPKVATMASPLVEE
jgi:hypothetical protein